MSDKEKLSLRLISDVEEISRLRAENEILREALLKIGDIADPQLASEAWMIQIAQDALNRVEEK